MAAFAMAAMTALGSTVSTVGSAVGSAVSSVGSAIGIGGAAGGTGSTFASILQGGLGLVGAMSAIRAGSAQADAYRSQAADTRLDVTQEQIDATNRETSLRKGLLKSLGERDVAYAASGLDLSFGTPATARAQAADDAQQAVEQDQTTSDLRQSRLRARADTLDALAGDAESASWLKAGGSVLGSAFDIVKRG